MWLDIMWQIASLELADGEQATLIMHRFMHPHADGPDIHMTALLDIEYVCSDQTWLISVCVATMYKYSVGGKVHMEDAGCCLWVEYCAPYCDFDCWPRCRNLYMSGQS